MRRSKYTIFYLDTLNEINKVLDFTWNSTGVGILPWHLNYAFTFETLIQYGLEQVGKMIGNRNGYICTEVWTIWKFATSQTNKNTDYSCTDIGELEV